MRRGACPPREVDGWIGVVAGAGELPRAMVEAALSRGLGVVLVRLDLGPGRRAGRRRDGGARSGYGLGDGARWPAGSPVVEYTLSPAEWERVVEAFRARRVRCVYAAGKVDRVEATALLEEAAAGEARALFERGRFLEDQDLSRLFAGALERQGIRLGSQHELLGHLLAPAGVWTRRPPDPREQADVEVGRRLAREVAALDIGQTVVVRHGVVLAVETAAEGTDAAIRRAGRLGGPGAVVVKASRPEQDLRFDTPVVGPGTLRAMKAAGASCLAVEAGRCVVLHREAVVRAADEAGIALVAF